VSFTVPKDIADKVLSRFPRSEPRQRIALTLLGFDHEPVAEEKHVIAANTQQSYRVVNEILDFLRDMNLFSSEIGSVPLFRFTETNRLSIAGINTLDASSRIGKAEPKEKLAEQEQEQEQEKDEEKNTPVEEGQGGVKISVTKGVSPRTIKSLVSRQESFETMIKGEINSIKSMLQEALEQPKPAPPAPVAAVEAPIVSGLKGQTQQSAAEQPANPGPAANPNDPFFNMTKEEVIDFYMNNPQTGRKLPGARCPVPK